MIFSYKQLQTYFTEPLPAVPILRDKLTMQAFEVEEAVEKDGDILLDIKVLPDRAGDAKSDLGMAREINTITGAPLKAEFAAGSETRLKITFSAGDINKLLGLDLSTEEIISLLARDRVRVENNIAHIPAERADLNIVEDLADEVGRLYGVYRIPTAPLPSPIVAPVSDPLVVKADKVREVLATAGYTEVYGYSLTDRGDRQIEKSVASDKNFLRANLTDGLLEKITANLTQVVFEHEAVKMFEIGTVFSATAETIKVAVGLGYRNLKLKKESLPAFIADWKGKTKQQEGIEILETDLEKIPLAGQPGLAPFIHLDRIFQPVSPYPRVIRDVAVWVPAEVSEEEVKNIIKESAGALLFDGPVQFDRFEKEGRVSLAFRQVFQSYDKTLSDTEVNAEMDKVIVALEGKGWEVRK